MPQLAMTSHHASHSLSCQDTAVPQIVWHSRQSAPEAADRLQKQASGPRGGSSSFPSHSRVLTTKAMSIRAAIRPGKAATYADTMGPGQVHMRAMSAVPALALCDDLLWLATRRAATNATW